MTVNSFRSSKLHFSKKFVLPWGRGVDSYDAVIALFKEVRITLGEGGLFLASMFLEDVGMSTREKLGIWTKQVESSSRKVILMKEFLNSFIPSLLWKDFIELVPRRDSNIAGYRSETSASHIELFTRQG